MVGQGGTSLPWSLPEHYHLGMAWKMVSKKENVSMISCRGQNRTDSIVCTDEEPVSGLNETKEAVLGVSMHLFIVLRLGAALCPLNSSKSSSSRVRKNKLCSLQQQLSRCLVQEDGGSVEFAPSRP